MTGHFAGMKLRAVDLTLPLHALPVLAYVWTALEGRRRARARLSARDWVMVLGPATLVMYLLTLTPTLTVHGRPRGTALFHWVYTYVPGAAAFRAPGRWVLVFVLPLALVASVALGALTDRLPRRARAAAATIVLLIVMLECLPLPIPWQRRPPVPPADRWVAQQPGDFAVAALPANDARHAAWAMLWATTHWKRLVNGAFVFVPPTLQRLADDEEAVGVAALASTLRSIYPLRYAIVNRSRSPRPRPRHGPGSATIPVSASRSSAASARTTSSGSREPRSKRRWSGGGSPPISCVATPALNTPSGWRAWIPTPGAGSRCGSMIASSRRTTEPARVVSTSRRPTGPGTGTR